MSKDIVEYPKVLYKDGKWSDKKEYTVTVNSKEEEIEAGKRGYKIFKKGK